MGKLGDFAKGAAKSVGSRALEKAKEAMGPTVIAQTGQRSGMPVSDNEVIIGGNISKAMNIAKHTQSAVRAIQANGTLDVVSWARKFAPGVTFSLDTTHSHQGTILKVTCPDVPTAKLVCQRLSDFVSSNKVATDVGWESGDKGKAIVLVTLGNL